MQAVKKKMGRPPSPPGTKKIPISYGVLPEVRNAIPQLAARYGIPHVRVIEALVLAAAHRRISNLDEILVEF